MIPYKDRNPKVKSKRALTDLAELRTRRKEAQKKKCTLTNPILCKDLESNSKKDKTARRARKPLQGNRRVWIKASKYAPTSLITKRAK